MSLLKKGNEVKSVLRGVMNPSRESPANAASSTGSLQLTAAAMSPAGYAAPADIQVAPAVRSTIAAIANQVLRDPVLLRQISDRVYELLLDDLRQQRDRSCKQGGWF